MTLQQIIYALKIAEEGSMNKAAESLFVSQPTLTSAIQELENELNIQIFIRSRKGVEMTNEGRAFLDDIRQFYNQYEILQDKYNGNSKPRPKFSVSTQHFSFAVKCFVNMVQKLGLESYKLGIHETRTMDVIRNVGTSMSEIGILYLSNYNRKYILKLLDEYNLEFEFLTKCDACVYVHRQHPLANKDSITLQELKDYPCLSFDQGEDNLFYLSEEILTDNEFERSIKASDRSTVLNLMIGLNGYTLCPGIVCEELNGDSCRVIPYKEDASNPNRTMEIGYIRKRNGFFSYAAKAYIEELKNYFVSLN